MRTLKKSTCQGYWQVASEATGSRLLFYGPLWVVIVPLMFLFYYLTWRKVAELERKTAKYSFDSHKSFVERKKRKLKYSTQIAHQAYFYFGAALLSMIFTSSLRLVQLVTGKTNYFLLLISSFFVPLQGFMNCLVYFPPCYKKLRNQYPNLCFCKICFKVIFNMNDTASAQFLIILFSLFLIVTLVFFIFDWNIM